MSKDTENQAMAQFYAGYRLMLRFINFASWKWLAVTTGVMVYMSFENSVKVNFSPGQAKLILGSIVIVFYVMIDMGLDKMIRSYILGRDLTPKEKAVKNHNRLLKYILAFLLIRLLATSLSSIWSGGEIGDGTTPDFDPTVYTASQVSRDSTDNAKLNSATTERDNLRSTEAQRLEKAELKCQEEVRAVYDTGSRSQRDMWDCCRGFYDNLDPSSKYYKTNKSFADRIHAAEANCQVYADAETSKTIQAENLYYSVTADTTAGDFLANLGQVASNESNKLVLKENRRTNLVIFSDFLAIILGLICTVKLVDIEAVTGEQKNKKNLSDVLVRYMEKSRQSALAWMEWFLGIDLDGNGEIGTVDNRLAATEKRSIAAGMSTAGTTTSIHQEEEIPPPTPRQPIYLLPTALPEDTTAPIVATRSYNDLSAKEREVEAKLWLSHYRDFTSKINAVKSNAGYTDKGRAKAEARHQEEIDLAIKKLKSMGLTPVKIDNVYQLIPVE